MGSKSNMVTVSSMAYGRPARHRRALERFGLSETEDGTFAGVVDAGKVRKLEKMCKRWHLDFRYADRFGQRSTDYRRKFFQQVKPVFGKYYFCAYCGMPLTKEKMTIDHIYPVHLASSDIKTRKRMKKAGLSGVNDIRNLVPACYGCNKRKGTRTGGWVIKGRIGRKQGLWPLRWTLRILLMSALMVTCMYLAWQYMQYLP